MAKKQSIRQETYDLFRDQIVGVWDNGGRSMDRYTVVYDEPATVIPGEEYLTGLSMDNKPFHPQGFCQHGQALPGDHLGKEIDFLYREL